MKKPISVNLGDLLISLSEITDLANPQLAQHQLRTTFIAFKLAQQLNLSADVVENIFAASLLHDIGAVSVEEKVSLHRFEALNTDIHCVRGEILLEQTPWLKKISKLVRIHHKPLIEWDKGIEDEIVLGSQIILLADFVERLIDRNQYVLHQTEKILKEVKSLKDKVVHKLIIDCFEDLSKREKFWFDLTSSRLRSLLLDFGPFKNEVIEHEGILLIAKLYRDIIDFKSRFTATHTSGVAACAERLSQILGVDEYNVGLMSIAGNLHDIGKLVIPNSILEKPDKLTTNEYAIIKCHTYYTYHILNAVSGLDQVAKWAAFHHEKLDGSGYPFHCKAEELDTGSRILAVADIFTAISEDRPYRKGMMKEEVYSVIRRQTENNLIDKKIVDLLFDNYEDINCLVREQQCKAEAFYKKRFLAIIERAE